MIAELAGTLSHADPGAIVVDVGGVGYLVYCSATTQRDLPPPGQRVSLRIDTHVRQDHIRLYGFATAAERAWFQALQGVQGVGARVALAILSAVPPALLAEAVAAQEAAPLTRAAGVGPRLAKRIVGELRDVPTTVSEAPRAPGSETGAGSAPADPASAGSEATRDAVSALVNLGYGRAEAFAAVSAAARANGGGADVAALVRGSLAELAR